MKKSVYWRLLKMVRPYKSSFLLSIITSVLGYVSSIGLLGWGAAGALAWRNGSKNAVLFLGLAAGCAALRGIFRYFEHYTGHDMAFRLLFELRKRIFKAMEKQAPARLLQKDSGDLCSLLMGDVELIETFFAHTLTPVVTAVLIAAGMLAILYSLHPSFAVLFFCVYLISGFILPQLSCRNTSGTGREYRKHMADFNTILVEKLQGIKEIMLFNQEDRIFNELLSEKNSGNKAYSRIRTNEGILNILVELLLVSTAAISLYLSFSLYRSGAISIEKTIVVLAAGLSSFGPFVSLMNLSNNLVNVKAAAERIFNFLDDIPTVENSSNPLKEFNVTHSPEASRISFAYPNTKQKLFANLNFKAETGKITALKAESGRGKSSLLYLLMRFYDPDAGIISLDKIKLGELDLALFRSQISYFVQDTFIFDISIRENIRMARPEASDADVRNAARMAGADSFIKRLPDAYETRAGERGRRFSCGERQRIGLARIFLQDNRLVLLDEPVSNLDRKNEKIITSSLFKWIEDKTIIMISHRHSLLEKADKIMEI